MSQFPENTFELVYGIMTRHGWKEDPANPGFMQIFNSYHKAINSMEPNMQLIPIRRHLGGRTHGALNILPDQGYRGKQTHER